MTQGRRPAVSVQDVRGTPSSAPGAVLADPSGRRARRLRAIGRIVGALFLLWFACLVLAGLGLLPASGIPFASSVGPGAAQPRKLPAVPRPEATSRADLAPARAAAATAAAAVTPGARESTEGTTQAEHTASPKRPGRVTTKTTPATPARPVTTTPGNSGSTPAAAAPGQATDPGSSGTAPGKTTPHAPAAGNGQTSTTAPGNSGASPGHTRTSTTGHGPPG